MSDNEVVVNEGAYSLQGPSPCNFILPIQLTANVGTAEYAQEAAVDKLNQIDLYFNTIESLDLKASDINEILKFQMKSGNSTGDLFNTDTLADGSQAPTYSEIFVEFVHILKNGASEISANTSPYVFNKSDYEGKIETPSGDDHVGNVSLAGEAANAIYNAIQELSAPLNNDHTVSLMDDHNDTTETQTVLHTINDSGNAASFGVAELTANNVSVDDVKFRPGPMAMLPIQYLNAITAGTTNSQLVRNVDGIKQQFHNEQIGLDLLNALLNAEENHANVDEEGTNSPLLKSLLDIMLTNQKRHVFTQDTISGLLSNNEYVAPSRISNIAVKEFEYLKLNSFNFYPGDTLTFRLDFNTKLNIDVKTMPTSYSDLITRGDDSTIKFPSFLSGDVNVDGEKEADVRRTAVTIRLTETEEVCETHMEDAASVLSAVREELRTDSDQSVVSLLDTARTTKSNLDQPEEDVMATGTYDRDSDDLANNAYWNYDDAVALFGNVTAGTVEADYNSNPIAIDWQTFVGSGNVINANTTLLLSASKVEYDAKVEVLNSRIEQLEGARSILLVKERYWDSVVDFWAAEKARANVREAFSDIHKVTV